MSNFKTRQRDLLQILLDSEAPMGASETAEHLHLTARQVNYDLKGLKRWLSQWDVSLVVRQGVGAKLVGPPKQYTKLEEELTTHSRFQLFLPAGLRCGNSQLEGNGRGYKRTS
jgi:transcriptional antiterminator